MVREQFRISLIYPCWVIVYVAQVEKRMEKTAHGDGGREQMKEDEEAKEGRRIRRQ